MRKRNGFILAVVALLLVPGCKTDTTPPRPGNTPAKAEAPVKAEGKVGDRQIDIEPSAREVAERFLKALKHFDSPEGRKTLAETRWRQTMKFPEYQAIDTLSEAMFLTDIPGVRGYRQVARLAIPREGGRPLIKRYVLIAYEDAKAKSWKVFDFCEFADAEQEAGRACDEKTLAGSDASTSQGCYVHCSYWLLMEGKIGEAEKAAKKANALYARNSDPDDEARYYKARADATLDMIARMAGTRL